MSTQATGFSPDEIKTPTGSFLGGEYVSGDGTEYEVLRPSDGHVIRTERGASASLVDRAVTAAAKAYRIAPDDHELAELRNEARDDKEKAAQELTQAKLGEQCRLHRTFVGSVERGERNLSLLNLRRSARVLRVSLSELLKDLS